MNLTDQYIPIEYIPAANFPPVSSIVSRGNKVRVQNTLLEVVSTNDAKMTVTFRVVGVFPQVEAVENGN